MAEAVTSSVVGKVVELLFGVAKREIDYMLNYTQNVGNFKKILQDLKDMTGRVQQQIDLANSKGDNLLVGVKEWMDDAKATVSEAEKFLEQEANANKTCFNWVTRYRYSKLATKKASSLLQHQEGGKTFESGVSVYTPAPGPIDVYQIKNLDGIDTQNLALEKVIAAIEDENIQIIGIHGLGGVGKTTLAKEVASKMKNHFANVAFTTVSKTVNVDKVQKDIENATKRIMKGEKVLIILDDLWEKLNLEEMSIPWGTSYMNCKILLTSRSEDVCTKMNAQRKICVNPLRKDEIWILFKQVVGERIETDVTLKPVAMEVAQECGGLPLLVQAVGSALKDRNINSWNSALTQLKEHAPLDIDPDIKKAYTHLKLSYDYLESEEAKSCFLLCSMWPEDGKILLEDLVYYGVGLAKFKKLKSLNDAKDRVQNVVNILTSSGLLLNMNDDENGYTKMHDVVRDVALLIASEGNNMFLVEAGKGLSEWLPRNNTLENYTGISLMLNKISKLPDYKLHLPHLNIFLIFQNILSTISDEFIRGMKEVRVLDMSLNYISKLPQSLKLLTKLRMLSVYGNESLDEISILGDLKNLEILILCKTGIKEIPPEIGQLVNLRLFDVSECKSMCHIAPGVLSKLCWLEELLIGFYLMKDDGINDSLVEVMKLSKITYLNLVVPRSDVIPQGFIHWKLNDFVIQIGGYPYPWKALGHFSERCLVFSNDPFDPNTSFELIENMYYILRDLYHKGINDIQRFYLEHYPNVRCLVDWDELQTSRQHQLGDGDEEGKTEDLFFTKLKHLQLHGVSSLEVVWKCRDEYISRHFTNLVTLDICKCDKLKRVLTVSIAKGLVSLQNLFIEYCEGLEEVIWGEGDDENIIVFPSLANIRLIFLKSLESFCSGNSTIEYPSLVDVELWSCYKMKKWGNGIQDTPNLKIVNSVPIGDGPNAINHFVKKYFEVTQLSDTRRFWEYFPIAIVVSFL